MSGRTDEGALAVARSSAVPLERRPHDHSGRLWKQCKGPTGGGVEPERWNALGAGVAEKTGSRLLAILLAFPMPAIASQPVFGPAGFGAFPSSKQSSVECISAAEAQHLRPSSGGDVGAVRA